MATDRDLSLKRAEKFLRQGRLDGAIEEYVHLLDELPNDWNSRNALGDLYVRARQVDQAVAQFTRIADHFAQEGFLPRAIALYRKVIKIKPDDEHALLQSADVNAQQGLLVDAKACLATVADERRRKGDAAGANEILLKIATVDPNDLTARLNAARAAAEMGDTAGAAARYKQLAADLFERSRGDEAIEALAQTIQLDASDGEARNSLVAAYLKRGDAADARRAATTAAHFKAIAEDLLARDQEDEGLDALAEAVQRDPSDIATRVALVSRLLARGEAERASSFVAAETLGDDPALALLAIEVELRVGHKEAARHLLQSLVERDHARCGAIVALGCKMAEQDADAAFECIDVATDAMAGTRDWNCAADALQQFTAVVPLHIPALIKLVDVCVDGDLDAPLFAAQAQLAEAYIAAGRSFEARVIAEDLVARAPQDPANIDRFRRALVLAGEPDPDAVIADRLSADQGLDLEDLNVEEASEKEAEPLIDTPPEEVEIPPMDAGAPIPAFSAASEPATAVQEEGPAAGVGAAVYQEFHEIDLSGALGDMNAGQMSLQPERDLASPGTPEPGGELEAVFEEFRREVLREQVSSTAGQHYKLALTYHDMGMTDECMKALEVAAKSPRYRFQAAILLARMYGQQGKRQQAIDWYERAAETPAPSVGASRALLYELGRALEDEGESVRALAVYLELEAEAGEYRDVGTRVKALSS